MDIKKNEKYYLNLPWSYDIEQEEEDGERFFIVRVKELPGVCTDGDTIEQAMENIKEAIHGAIKLYLKMGDEIPEPVDKTKYQGKIHYRTDPGFHYRLVRLSLEKHLSLNKTIDHLLREAVKRESLR